MDSVKEEELNSGQAASKIQRLWRSFTNRKIYKYYKDIILFKCKGNPARLLKAINPVESQLLECSAKVHLRFRLGGENFPPNIYYKIFSHGALVDLNSFAPRDYSVIKRGNNEDNKKIKYEQYKQNKDDYVNQGWYLRIDNNGWRPISHKVFNKTDYVELFSANKIRYYHFKSEKREEKVLKKQRLNKLRWIQNMYKNARKEEEELSKKNLAGVSAITSGGNALADSNEPEFGGQLAGQNKMKANGQENQQDIMSDDLRYAEYEKQFKEMEGQQEDGENDSNSDDGNGELDDLGENVNNNSDPLNPLKDPKYIDMDEDQFDSEVKDLIEWSKNLDYDEYVRDWFQLSTSNASEAFVVKHVHNNNTPFGSVALMTNVQQNKQKNQGNKQQQKQQLYV